MSSLAKTCLKCRRPCDGEAFVALKDGSTFHRYCFTCDICQGELPLKFALKNGKYYHTECYANAKATSPKCLKCDTPIIPAEISVVLGNDMRFHSRCFICDTCQRPLSDRFYSNNGKFFHEECISCSICNVALMGQNFSQLQDGGYICDNCLYKSMRGGTASSTASNPEKPPMAPSYRPAPPAQNVPYFNPEGGFEEHWAQQGNDWNNYGGGLPQQGYGAPGGYGGPPSNGYYQGGPPMKPYQDDMGYGGGGGGGGWNQPQYGPGGGYQQGYMGPAGRMPPQSGPPPNMPRPMGNYPPRR